MSETHEIVQIFVASPSGLDQERQAILEVVDEINRRNSSHWKLQFKAIGWEDTVGGNRRAQDIINRDLETCDYFFGILADHWGSPPQSRSDVKTVYTSGFQEEYELAQKLFDTGRMKDILLFFKKIPDDKMRDIGPSLQKVLNFRRKVREDKKSLYTEFQELDVFRTKIGDALSKIGWGTVRPQKSRDIVAPIDKNASEVTSPSESPIDSRGYFLPGETRAFLEYITKRTDEHTAVTNIDVARMRLIASGVYRIGNDEIHVGVHDANLLFLHRSELALSVAEKNTLLNAGLGYMESQNVPFWYWTGGNVKKVEQFIQYRMLIGDENVSSSALRVATTFGYDILEFLPSAGRGYWIKEWFSDEQKRRLHSAAQMYLSRWAKEDDIPTLEEIRNGKSGIQAAELDCIIVATRFRSSRNDGLNELKERNPDQISASLMEILRDIVREVSSKILCELAKLKATDVRLVSIRELIRRNALSRTLAEELSGDNSMDVRLEAIKYLSDMTVPISESRAKAALTISRGGVLGGGNQGSDTTKFDDYQRHLLKKKSLSDLLELEEKGSPFHADALLTAFRKFPRKTAKRMRGLLNDGFEGRFEERLKDIERQASWSTPDFIKGARGIKEFCCLQQTRIALDILATQMKKQDLPLIREVADREEIEISEAILAYFSRFGSWEDVDRILKLKEKVGGGYTALGIARSRNDRMVGKTLFKVGNFRMVDLLGKVKQHNIKASVIGACTQRVISGLGDGKILELMNEENDLVRKITALKCLESFPKARVGKLLKLYTAGDKFRYYNVIHWLDLGGTMPRHFVKEVVRKELETI